MATLRDTQEIQVEDGAEISSVHLSRVCCFSEDHSGDIPVNSDKVKCSFCVSVVMNKKKRSLSAGCFDSYAEAVKRIEEIKNSI